MVNPGPLWQDIKQAIRRTACRIAHHRPLKIIDKATVDSVAFVTGGTGAAVHVDASHVVCQRCGARQHVDLRGRVRWVG